ncbi:MAG: DUF4159 domain-containing protein [Verrucomicrobiae bacterium]|nr:DUF4159 domain-containing protein [Verrucomicrobiae bacterium]
MTASPRLTTTLLTVVLISIGVSLAQEYRERDGNRGRRRGGRDDRAASRTGIPDWGRKQALPDDVFTFVRIQYQSHNDWGWRGGKWRTDYPDSDLNFSYRLEQLTSLDVDPEGKILTLTDPELANYPMIYLIEPGEMALEEAERESLRSYLLNGGFLLVDDFWGDWEWENFYLEMKKVFPEKEPEELTLDHEIFHCVFDLTEKPQLPSISVAQRYGITYEPGKPGAEEVHYRALFDDDGRMMAIICHNTDLGDGWEREGEDPWYFKNFSEPKAYPMGINIIFYAMTH